MIHTESSSEFREHILLGFFRFHHSKRSRDPFVLNKVKAMSVESHLDSIEISTFKASHTVFLLPFPYLFTLEIGGLQEVQKCTSLLQTIVTAPMSCTLRNLGISVPPGTFSTSLGLPSLPCLENFSLELSSDAEISNEEPVNIASFLLSLPSKLETLEITNNSRLLFSSLFVYLPWPLSSTEILFFP
jgi:hypothetical protein